MINKEAWGAGGAYEQYVGRWSRPVAGQFLAWLDVPPGMAWGEVGCGTGAITGTIAAACAPKSVAAIDRSTGFLAAAAASLRDARVSLAAADAAALPWASRSFDATVSGLVLNFVPDSAAMVQEMARVTRPGGQVALYVWDYREGMEMMRHFWDAAAQVDPAAAELDEGDRFPLCAPEPLKKLFEAAGLASVAVRAIDIPTVFRDFDDYWSPFLNKVGAAPAYLVSRDSGVREAIRDLLKERLASGDGPLRMTARAWAVRGVV